MSLLLILLPLLVLPKQARAFSVAVNASTFYPTQTLTATWSQASAGAPQPVRILLAQCPGPSAVAKMHEECQWFTVAQETENDGFHSYTVTANHPCTHCAIVIGSPPTNSSSVGISPYFSVQGIVVTQPTSSTANLKAGSGIGISYSAVALGPGNSGYIGSGAAQGTVEVSLMRISADGNSIERQWSLLSAASATAAIVIPTIPSDVASSSRYHIVCRWSVTSAVTGVSDAFSINAESSSSEGNGANEAPVDEESMHEIWLIIASVTSLLFIMRGILVCCDGRGKKKTPPEPAPAVRHPQQELELGMRRDRGVPSLPVAGARGPESLVFEKKMKRCPANASEAPAAGTVSIAAAVPTPPNAVQSTTAESRRGIAVHKQSYDWRSYIAPCCFPASLCCCDLTRTSTLRTLETNYAGYYNTQSSTCSVAQQIGWLLFLPLSGFTLSAYNGEEAGVIGLIVTGFAYVWISVGYIGQQSAKARCDGKANDQSSFSVGSDASAWCGKTCKLLGMWQMWLVIGPFALGFIAIVFVLINGPF